MRQIATALAIVCLQAFTLPAQSSTNNSGNSSALQIGDALRVGISREPTLSGDFPIDEEGFVTLPLIGRWHAAGAGWTALRDSLLAAYRREVRSEAITVVPLRRVYVMGSVLRPGVYMLDPTFGLQGALALAGGAAPDGNLQSIRVQRDGQTLPNKIALNSPPAAFSVRSGDELYVERRSWFDRNSTLLLTSIISIAGIVVTLASRN